MASVAEIRKRATEILKEFYGSNAKFRPGQLEAIVNTVQGKRSLVVQKTGWGKSIVYFIACKILRQENRGLTLIISPLLALMNNQIEAAKRLDLRVATINSNMKQAEAKQVYQRLNQLDALIVAPERLGNELFNQQLVEMQVKIGALVVDEVHCISDWGHDFRPDYQRIVKLISVLPKGLPILGTTATANQRVIDDVCSQLGENILIARGDLMRNEISIQVNPPQTDGEKLAWITDACLHDARLANQKGLIYCLTVNDCKRVSHFLQQYGISAAPYYSGNGAEKEQVEQNLAAFENGLVKILVCTIKLGMGYDTSDIRFVMHYQLPKNIIAYYQQIGRAGRDGRPAYAILLHGRQDEEILTSFIRKATVSPKLMAKLIQLISEGGMSKSELLAAVNIKASKLDEVIKFLMVHDYVYEKKEGGPARYYANLSANFDIKAEQVRQEKLLAVRQGEVDQMHEFISLKSCYMQFIANCLDAPDRMKVCGNCANCHHGLLFNYTGDAYRKAATRYLSISPALIKPRAKWGNNKSIPKNLQAQVGWVFCNQYRSPLGEKIQGWKYRKGYLPAEFITANANFLRQQLLTNNIEIDAVASVPSLRHPNFVPGFAYKLANELKLEYVDAVKKTKMGSEQKDLLNNALQQKNVADTVVIDASKVFNKTILLVDDIINSGWSFTVISALLLEAGAKAVYPFALLSTGTRTEGYL